MAGLAGKYEFLALSAFLTRADYEEACAPQTAFPDYEAGRRLFESQLPGGFSGTYWHNPISNDVAANRYGTGGLP